MRKYFILAIATVTLTACLDENPRDRIDEDFAFSDAANLYLNTVANLYNYIGGNSDSQGLQGTTRGVYDLCTFTTDEAMLPTRGGDWYDGGLWQSLYLHTYNGGTQPVEGTWDYLYKVIMLCNQALEKLGAHKSLLTTDEYVAYTSEVKALRAMFYYYLLDLYGQVPYVTATTTDVSSIHQISRSSLFDHVWTELTNALPHLAYARSNIEGIYYGRMTRHVAWMLLAKMALNAEIWTDDDWTNNNHESGSDITLDCEGHRLNAWEACIYWCDKLTQAGYRLEDDYSTNFAIYNEISLENIFTIPMDKIRYKNIFVNLFRSRHYNHGGALGFASENGTSATVSAVRTYGYGTNEVDNRYALNFYSDTVYVNDDIVRLDNRQPLVYEPLKVALDLTSTPYEKTAGARMNKYEIDITAYEDGQLQDNDIVIMRYADVLLMIAEAKVRNGENGDNELNAVRARVHMPARRATLDNILAERLMELQWEGWRRQDLVRFGRFHQAYDQRIPLDNEGDRHTTVFPIPFRAINLNPNLKQNPGY